MTISRKLLVYLLGSIFLLLLGSSVIVINSLATDSHESVQNDLANIVQLEGNKINAFFKEKGQRLQTISRNPLFYQWLESYQNKEQDVSNDKLYQAMIDTFTAESKSDPTIKSVFFAHNDSQVYFYEKGAHWQTDYNLRTRPWFIRAAERNTLHVGNIDRDILDNSIYNAIYKPVTNQQGKLIGIYGMDILLTTIADIVDNVQYRGQGQAILTSKSGEILYMPQATGETPLELNAPLSSLDSDKKHTGFSQLAQKLSSQKSGRDTIVWHGHEQEVAFFEINGDSPELSWMLTLMVPQSLVDEKVNQSITTSIVFISIILSAIALVTLFVTRSIVKPLKQIESAMSEISHGDGDLTKRLEILGQDEVGHVAKEFNRFVDKVHQLVTEVSHSSHNLNDTVHEFSELTKSSTTRSSHAIEQTKMALGAVNSVAQSAQEILDNAKTVNESASDANSSALDGQKEVTVSVEAIEKMASRLEDATAVIENLRKNSDNIGEVLSVIKGIADQTNLLALNAAIEAARAGEQGRGFAVVADEVRTLASRTQESTDNIQEMIQQLQTNSQEAESVMLSSREQMRESVTRINHIKETFNVILEKVDAVQQQSVEITHATENQNTFAARMLETINDFREVANSGLESANKMKERCDSLTNNSEQLNSVVERFKI